MPAEMGGGDLSAQTIMFHEYAHHMLLSSSTEYYPRWLSEGMAEFFMVSRINRDGGVTIGLPNNDRRYELTAFSRMHPSELLAYAASRSETRSEGKALACTVRTRWSPYP